MQPVTLPITTTSKHRSFILPDAARGVGMIVTPVLMARGAQEAKLSRGHVTFTERVNGEDGFLGVIQKIDGPY
ncbi:hypothetical protein ACET3X_002863 [Alternaria dauci]|uniref:Uncharacterized protein n=1 Tax=Alternaria dauci TaxID=48095 RepID=A0ABR3UQR9_9PLEO